MLHGYPQTHVMWHHLAPALAERFSVVIADLPGYGASDVPKTDANHTPSRRRGIQKTRSDTTGRIDVLVNNAGTGPACRS